MKWPEVLTTELIECLNNAEEAWGLLMGFACMNEGKSFDPSGLHGIAHVAYTLALKSNHISSARARAGSCGGIAKAANSKRENAPANTEHTQSSAGNTTPNTVKVPVIAESAQENTPTHEPPAPQDQVPQKKPKEKTKPSEEKTKPSAESKPETVEDLIIGYTDVEQLREALRAYVEMRKQKKKPMTPYMMKLHLKTLSKIHNETGQDEVAVVNMATIKYWENFYQIRDADLLQQAQQPMRPAPNSATEYGGNTRRDVFQVMKEQMRMNGELGDD